jgi:hypothetical protein
MVVRHARPDAGGHHQQNEVNVYPDASQSVSKEGRILPRPRELGHLDVECCIQHARPERGRHIVSFDIIFWGDRRESKHWLIFQESICKKTSSHLHAGWFTNRLAVL